MDPRLQAVLDEPEETALPLDALTMPLSMLAVANERQCAFPHLKLPDLLPEDGKFFRLFSHQKTSIVLAIDQWQRVQDTTTASGFQPENTPFPQSLRARLDPGQQLCQRQRLPCASGKTICATMIGLLTSRNMLVLTNSKENAEQFVHTLRKETNICAYFPVKLLRSNAAEDRSFKTMTPTDLEKEWGVDSFVLDNAPPGAIPDILGCGGFNGVLVADCNAFKQLDDSTTDRKEIRRGLFCKLHDLIVIDEADSVMAHGCRDAFANGAVGPTPKDEQYILGYGEAAFPLKYNRLFAMSGTWHRSAKEEREFLESRLGPMTFSMPSKQLEASGLLARTKIAIVRCQERPPWLQKLVENHTKAEKSGATHKTAFRTALPAKFAVLERLVRFHSSFGHKIMIFSTRKGYVAMLHRLFPHAIAIDGDVGPDERIAKFELFGKPVTKDSPLIWITTSLGGVGNDVPDCSVVIQFDGQTDSPMGWRQFAGRAQRRMFERCWVYDLIGAEVDWADSFVSASTEKFAEMASRYAIFYEDGYADDMLRINSDNLIHQLNEYIAQWQDPTDHTLTARDELLSFVNENLAYDKDVVLLNHAVTLIWTNHSGVGDLAKRVKITMFDSPDQVRLEHKKNTSTPKCNEQTKAMQRLGKQIGHTSKKRKRDSTVGAGTSPATADSVNPVVHHPQRLTPEFFSERARPSDFKAGLCNAVADALSMANLLGHVAPDKQSPTFAADVWASMMKLRAVSYKIAFDSDKFRMEKASNMIEMNAIPEDASLPPLQERCMFLF